MIDLAATLLEVVDRTTRRTGPVSLAIDRIADRLLPQTTASAGSCPPSGKFYCGYTCGSGCWWWLDLYRKKYIYYDDMPTCNSNKKKCYKGCNCHQFDPS